MVTAVDYEIVDFGSSANGRPDPGETVDLIATLKNFGSFATNVQIELNTTDPYITIIDGSADLGDMALGEAVDNSSDPFAFEVAAHAPTGRIVEFSVRATFTGGETLSGLILCIGRFDYLVWDPTGDRSSGPVIAAILEDAHYTGRFCEILPLDQLNDYATLWVSVGIYPNNFVIDGGGSEGPAIVDFMAAGGCIYLEGGDVWAYDSQFGGFDFRPHFGINATDDGSGDLSHVMGVSGELTDGMDFVYVGESSFIDHLDPTGHGFAFLSNSSPVYDCAIAGDAGSHRTVGTSFEFSGLQDGAEPSTRAVLAGAIMDFFQVDPNGMLFTDGFESGGCTVWTAMVP